MYTYRIANLSESSKWIYIECNEEDSVYEHGPFVALVQHIAGKWNNGEWEGNVFSAGEMRFRVKNDPVDLVYQWDDLFGIVFEYEDSTKIAEIKAFLADNYNIR